ncbi:MAG: hypothetical protein HN600_16975 [Bacteroidetes bacterium]|jgi:hypothetical protein|nr:hypothetical protein [Cytophagia bacterium]MBT7828282.1 hypothetical protein [Bacteroidota bacterium]
MNNTIATDRFYLAAFLMERGIELKEHARSNDRSTFIFDNLEVKNLINDYYLDLTSISPRKYASAIRNLKTIMYNTSHNNKSSNYNDISKKEHSCNNRQSQ